MQYQIFATDYDGTLAHHGVVEPSAVAALERLRASGRKAMMVTGRELEDLRKVFSRLDLFDVVVAENGALLFYPSSGEVELLHEPPPDRFVHALREANVKPLSVGHIIVATMEPNESVVLRLIRELGLELEIIFNKGAVMILPTGVNKATGLAAALQKRGVIAAHTVGVGDAENDHAFLNFCGCGVAVANALASLKEQADYITRAPHGLGVVELIDLLIETDLRDICVREHPALRDDPGMFTGLGVQRPHTP
jgi:hydroxymethylpyrimidine pyrophosphatase-like HAD family hydrolase